MATLNEIPAKIYKKPDKIRDLEDLIDRQSIQK
jgi:hypothetical protein